MLQSSTTAINGQQPPFQVGSQLPASRCPPCSLPLDPFWLVEHSAVVLRRASRLWCVPLCRQSADPALTAAAPSRAVAPPRATGSSWELGAAAVAPG